MDMYQYVVVYFHHVRLGQFARCWRVAGDYARGCEYYRQLKDMHERGTLLMGELATSRIMDNHVRADEPTHVRVVNG